SEMKKLLIFILNTIICVGTCNAAVRDGTSVSRQKNDKQSAPSQSRISTQPKRVSSRTAVLSPREITQKKSVSSRPSSSSGGAGRTARTALSPTTTRQSPVAKRVSQKQNTVSARATTTPSSVIETKTGAEYEPCKQAYFSCMDQFCTLKNDSYRRCSCNDRVFDLTSQRETLEQANEQLTVFTENLDVVGMTAEQATAMRTASDGENALTDDKSASKALLQAIMNSIRGEDTNVAGKHSDLNSINISFDTANAFGMTDAGQAIAAYNGLALYNAVYPQCRQAVRQDCTDASLQRAVTAYLMAIEQDCNTVQTAIDTTKKQLKSAVREGDAMLDMARVENRQKHNSSDLSTCIAEIESAILSEEVCGANYHKCLDNGEFIDISTGTPIAGVKDFYKLEQLLTFTTGIDAVQQKLSKISNNRAFVENFEARVKKFAAPAMDKCVESADLAWADYLDKALLDIYYAQKAKVAEIKQGCFDFVSSCYVNTNNSITDAMSVLLGDNNIVIKPDQIALSTQMCTDYVDSCNNMFDSNIIAEYIENQQSTDTLAACRAVVKQCFDKYGGPNYENFYYPYSGTFKEGEAPDWFTLYDRTETTEQSATKPYKSICANQLLTIDACKSAEMVEAAFGGFDKVYAKKAENTTDFDVYPDDKSAEGIKTYYGLTDNNDNTKLLNRFLRPTGVATEIYNQILSNLSTQCMNLDGRFVESQTIETLKQINPEQRCSLTDDYTAYFEEYNYNITKDEDICPANYEDKVDTQSWGTCSCWHNGGRRALITGNDTTKHATKCSAVYINSNNSNKVEQASLNTKNQVVITQDTAAPKELPEGI
ncbi:MAG: hypothetical protein J6R99_00135, partial [Alphaproteobacteria bacterium]|nr:hypothetical protein [Alphaproteobacteria bacterium]